MKRLLGALALLVLAACATEPTVYGPSSGGGMGYREQRIENERYRVTFRANRRAARRASHG